MEKTSKVLQAETSQIEVLRPLREYWDTRASTFTSDCERVEWGSERTQALRFDAFLDHNDLEGKSVLDVGCGVGGFYAHLLSRGIHCSYFGFDLSVEMVRHCCSRFPDTSFQSGDFLTWKADRTFDYTVAFGIHNVQLGNGWELLESVTRRQYELCTGATHVSLLTDRYKNFGENAQPWAPERVLSMALSITPYVKLRHDYLPNDFSVTLYRQPLIDTRKAG